MKKNKREITENNKKKHKIKNWLVNIKNEKKNLNS